MKLRTDILHFIVIKFMIKNQQLFFSGRDKHHFTCYSNLNSFLFDLLIIVYLCISKRYYPIQHDQQTTVLNSIKEYSFLCLLLFDLVSFSFLRMQIDSDRWREYVALVHSSCIDDGEQTHIRDVCSIIVRVFLFFLSLKKIQRTHLYRLSPPSCCLEERKRTTSSLFSRDSCPLFDWCRLFAVGIFMITPTDS